MEEITRVLTMAIQSSIYVSLIAAFLWGNQRKTITNPEGYNSIGQILSLLSKGY
jgi:hypothetical protein